MNISNHPFLLHKIEDNHYVIQRRFVEHSFSFSKEKKFVMLIGKIEHFVIVNEEEIVLPKLDKTEQIIATNKTKVYADNGDYAAFTAQEDEEGNITIVYDEAERGIIGEYDYFELLRNMPVTINTIISNVITRADSLGYFNNYQ